MNDYNQWNNSGPNTVYMNEKFQYETLSNYTAKTFLWMFAGLLVTFGVSLAAYMSNIGFICCVPALPSLVWPFWRLCWWWRWHPACTA